MKLAEYLLKKDWSATKFASHLGCETSTVTRLIKGERRPSIDLAARIEAITAGQVTLHDFIAPKASS